MKSKCIGALLLGGMIACAQAPSEPFPPVASVKQLMLDLIHPSSNDILLAIYRGGPPNEKKDDNEWAAVRRSAVTLAESGNMLMLPGRARDQGDWMKDAKLLVDVGNCRVQGRAGQRCRRARRSRRGRGRIPARLVTSNIGRTCFPRTEGRNELFAQKFSQGRRIRCRAHRRGGETLVRPALVRACCPCRCAVRE